MDVIPVSYKTVKKEASASFAEKKSVFVCTARPVFDEASALEFIASIKKNHGDASHCAYAYIIQNTNAVRFSDDGEPSSTAGAPILSVLQKSELTNVAAVVARYFGGILLGAGGLVRAYSQAARLAIKEAGSALYENFTEFEVLCGYADYDRLSKFAQTEKIRTDGAVFEEKVALCFAARSESFERLKAAIIDLSLGKAVIKKTGESFFSEDLC